ncbi:MAG: hypothetical protein K0S71_1585 [Clostridia bacterium]|jgi:hypothetical protein|nr:hypothetical protein [Clostridia bacterium]
MNTILTNSRQMPFYTDLRLVFEALEDRQEEYNWLITDLVYSVGRVRSSQHDFRYRRSKYIYKNDYPTAALDSEVVWISGEELSKIVYGNAIQFIWGVLSGFKKSTKIDLNDLEAIPYADGNSEFWIDEPQIQHPQADVEIVCWDSTLMLLLSKDDDLTNKFRGTFTDARDLASENKRQNKQINYIREQMLTILWEANKEVTEETLIKHVYKLWHSKVKGKDIDIENTKGQDKVNEAIRRYILMARHLCF